MGLPPARYVRKDDSALMRAIGVLLSPFNERFMESYFTTIGQTIYLPRKTYDVDWRERFKTSLKHEDDHREFFYEWGVVPTAILYLLFPVPVGYCYGRWVFERRAWLINIRARAPADRPTYIINVVVPKLCGPDYLWTWPRRPARDWFLEQAARMED